METVKPRNDVHSHQGWLDFFAVSMSLLCAAHCLLTPIIIVLFPILSTTIWVKHDFHLWMILFVLPTTTTAVFLGCKKHKDMIVIILSAMGLMTLSIVAIYETFPHLFHLTHQHGLNCHHHGHEVGFVTKSTMINLIGGLLLSGAHIRNYLLCRKSACSH